MIRVALLACVLLSPPASAGRVAILCSGTSLTNGYVFDPSPYPARLALLRGVPVVNFGLNGDRIANIIYRWRTYAKPYPYKVLVAEGGTNDLGDGANGTTLWGTFKDWVEEAQASGLIVVVVKIPPRSDVAWTGAQETQRLAFNAAADTWLAAHPLVPYVNSDALLGNGGDPIELNPDYRCEDELHLCADGIQALAGGVNDALE